MSSISKPDLAISEISEMLVKNRHFDLGWVNFEYFTRAQGLKLNEEELTIARDKLEQSELFEIQDQSTKYGRLIGVRLAVRAREILARHKGYLNYANRKQLNESEIIDLIFEHIKHKSSIQLDVYLIECNIAFNDNSIARIISKLKSSKLADVVEVITDGHHTAWVSINGQGLEELEDKSYSQYKAEQKHKQNPPPPIHIGGNVIGSSVGQIGSFSQQNTGSQNTGTLTKEEPKKKGFWDKFPEWVKVVAGLGAIAGLIKVVIDLMK